jgi:F420-dependent oxidoreductase-like protein
MQLGLFVDTSSVDSMVDRARSAAARGFASVWAPQVFEVDALTALAVIAREVPEVELATAVIPTYPRHPMVMAAQARTLSQLTGGRFTLGIGLSHRIVVEDMLEMSYERPVRHMREYLDVLLPLVAGESVDASGETSSFHGGIQIEAPPVPVVVAALGSQMLSMTGRRTAGTVTWMTGPGTIREHVVPTITRAAEEAGRPSPRVVMALPTCVTDDPDAARAKAAERFSIYGILPSYRAMLDREGAGGPGDVAIVGDEAAVRSQIEAVFEAGATEFVVVPFSGVERTLDLVQSMT